MSQGTVEKTFQMALERHQAGQLEQAGALYRQVLARQPNHADALHLLGVIALQGGRHDTAVDLIRQAIALRPRFPEAYSNLGIALRDKGQLDEAIAAYRRAIAFKANYPEAHNNLGRALKDQGRLDEAISACRRAIALKPKFPEAHNNLGNALKDKGRLDEAIAAHHRAIALKPDFPEAHNNLGNALKDKGRLDEAMAAYRQAIVLKPNYPEAHNNLGNALKDEGRLDEAIASYRQAIALKRNYPEAHSNLGVALQADGQLDAAVAAYQRAIALQPNFSDAYSNLGNALRDKGQLNESMAACRQAIALRPSHPDAHSNLGVALTCLGRFDEAADCFLRALELNPRLGVAHEHMAQLGRQPARPTDVDRLSRLTADESMPVNDRVRIGFALGKVLDDAGRYDEAFAAYARGNSMYRASRAAIGERFDAGVLACEVDQLIEEYTPARLERIGRVGSLSEAPVFIVGMPRSGTSLVEQIAASHPQVFGAGEIQDIRGLAAALSGWGGAVGTRELDVAAAARLAGDHVQHLAAMSRGAARVIDKMLDNTFRLALISVLFPNSRIIFCHRDARDTCLSCYFHFFRENLFTRDLADCGKRWVQTHRMMKHWRAVSPLRMLDIHYEELVADLEGQSRRLIDFLGLPWEKACLDFHRTQRPVLTFSNWQVRQPLFSKSVGRWRHYQRHLGPMLEALQEHGAAGGA